MQTMSDLPDEVTVGNRVEDGPAYIAGSEPRECARCGVAVWISPATAHEIRDGVYPETVVCVRCVMEDQDNG